MLQRTIQAVSNWMMAATVSQKPDRVQEQPRSPTARPWEFNSLDRANADAHHAPAPTTDSGRWDPQNFRDDEQFELDSLYSPGSPDEAMEGIAPENMPDNDEMLDTLMMMVVSLPEARAESTPCDPRGQLQHSLMCMEEEPLSIVRTRHDETSTLWVYELSIFALSNQMVNHGISH